MNKILAALIPFVFLATFANAQNKANIKGKIIDSLTAQPMEFATVAVLNTKDSSLVSYTVTSKTGEFSLHNLPAEKPLKLVVSFVSYQNYRKNITLVKGVDVDFGNIKLKSKGGLMSEVKIVNEVIPIIMKKDTMEFSAEAFKTPPNAVVEELLRRLPGVQVDIDGTITVNGKAVKKLLIDGKQFFANDPKIASKNLDAVLIDKVQIYDDRDDDPDHLIPDSKVDKIINLKFKQAIKKSTFGRVKAGGGTEDRFDGGILYNMFRDTLQVSLIGIGNNLNRTGFSNQDLASDGGFNRSGNDALYNGTVATGGRGYGGIQTVASGGVNINTDYGKKLKLNLLYFYSYTSNTYNSSSFNQQFFHDTTLSTNSMSNSRTTDSKHTISGLVEWNPDTTVKIRYTPNLSFNGSSNSGSSMGNAYSNFVPQLNSSVNSSSINWTYPQFQQNFSYYRKYHKKDESLNITHSLSIRPSSGLGYSDNDFTSFTSALTSSNLHRLADNANSNTDANLGIDFRYPLSKKLIADINASGRYNYSKGRLFTYNQNLQTGQYDLYIDSLSRDLRRNRYTETLRPQLSYNFTRQTRLYVSVGLQWMQTLDQFSKNIPDINRYNFYALPSINLNSNHLYFDYSESVSQPSINDLLPLTTFYSQLYSRVGNPVLLPTRSHNISGGYYSYNDEKQLNLNIYTGATVDENSTFTEKAVSSQGATIAKPVNKNGRYNIYTGINIGKNFKKSGEWQFRINTKLSGNFNHNFFQVNSSEGYQNSLGGTFNQQVFINWNNKVQLNPSYNFNPAITTYQNVDYSSVKYASQSLDMPVVIRAIKRVTIEANYTYTYNPLVATGFQKSINLLNIAIARQIQKKDRGEIRLSCYDLFDQNISAYRSTNGNSITDSQTQILKRYILLSYSYRFNSIQTKKK